MQSVHKVKQAKKMVLTVQSVQFVQADVAEPCDRTCGDVARICWLIVGRMGSRHVALFGANDWVPRGTQVLVVWSIVKMYWSPWGSTLSPPHHISLQNIRPTVAPPLVPYYMCVLYFI